MNRTVAAFLATVIALTGIAAVLVAVSWFMQAGWALAALKLIGHPAAIALWIGVGTAIWLAIWAGRRQRTAQDDEPIKPAPRLWLRTLRPPREE